MEAFVHFFTSFTLSAAGAYASVFSLFIALFGFYFTLRNVGRSEQAAKRAEAAANDAVGKIKLFDSVSGFSSALSILEEIKRLHRKDAWEVVLDRYAALKRILVEVRVSNTTLSENQNKSVQRAITHLSAMEEAVESELAKKEKPQEVAKFNAILSKDIEGIQEVLADIKAARRSTL